MNTLDQWEAEAKEFLSQFVGEEEERILALIELVRKKDELLKDMFTHFDGYHKKFCNGISNLKECNCGFTWTEQTIALTEQLKCS